MANRRVYADSDEEDSDLLLQVTYYEGLNQCDIKKKNEFQVDVQELNDKSQIYKSLLESVKTSDDMTEENDKSMKSGDIKYYSSSSDEESDNIEEITENLPVQDSLQQTGNGITSASTEQKELDCIDPPKSSAQVIQLLSMPPLPDHKELLKSSNGSNEDIIETLLRCEDSFMKKIDKIVKEMESEELSQKLFDKLSELKSQICDTVKPSFPSVKVYEFGSQISGLSTVHSDFDFFVDLAGDAYYGSEEILNDTPERRKRVEQMFKVESLFRNEPRFFSNIISIVTARAPILRFIYTKSQDKCDLSFLNGLCVENTKLIKLYLDVDQRVRWLLIAVKDWATANDLLSSASFTTYALTWMVLFYLMHKKIVPTVGNLMDDNCETRIQGWPFKLNCSKIHAPAFEESKPELLKNFFTFFINFDFQRSVICPRSGDSFKKVAINTLIPKKLPKEISSLYISYVNKHNNNEDIKFIISPCCVQDPFDLAHNLTKQVTVPVLKKFRRSCKRAEMEIKFWGP